MSVLPLVPLPAQTVAAARLKNRPPIGIDLLSNGAVSAHALVQALPRAGALPARLLGRGQAGDDLLYAAFGHHHQLGMADFTAHPPDPGLIDRWGAMDCLRDGLLPVMRAGDVTVIAAQDPETYARNRTRLTTLFGPTLLALSPPRRLESAVLQARGAMLSRIAERTVPPGESCRTWNATSSARLMLACMALATAAALWPRTVLAGLTLVSFVLFLATFAMKAAALWLALRPVQQDRGLPPVIARLPVVSILVALYREAGIAPRLVRRLGKLDYPRDLLDIVLVVEEGDHATRDALASADLPPWMRIVVAPEGRVKTKPRALNHALAFCKGSIVGVYDAEDAPEPDQIRRVVDRFHRRGPQVACLQGVLDFYNPATNWLSRCFTIEYAAWFRVILPGLQRLGVPIPLGGTTLFFRRDVLEKLGAWDAWNVTEDADLGIRLARHGYRTELIDSTTHEEANCRALPWIKQRSRWIKGYMMTYATHMRDPVLLWRQLGPRQFAGFQVLFLGSIAHVLMAPLIWSLWLLMLGLPHPLTQVIPGPALLAMSGLFLAAEALSIATGLVGLRRSGQKISPAWVPTLHVYSPLGALASYKALWEMMHRPFYWDKTSHGHFDQAE